MFRQSTNARSYSCRVAHEPREVLVTPKLSRDKRLTVGRAVISGQVPQHRQLEGGDMMAGCDPQLRDGWVGAIRLSAVQLLSSTSVYRPVASFRACSIGPA